MIEIKYKALFDIEFLHNFYANGKCGDILLEPTQQCTALLKQSGLRFMQTAFGAKVFANVKTVGAKELIRNTLAEGTKFTFLIKVKNSMFENFTDINSNKPASSHYYFRNLISNIASGGEPLLVANTTSKIVSTADLLPFASGSFSFSNTNTAAVQNSELRFIDSGEVFRESANNYNNSFNFSYDLRKTPGGRAKFFIDGAEQSSMYVIDATAYNNLFGVVEIFYKSNLPAEYQFQKADNSVETKFYKISFSSLATKWRYIVTKKFNKAITDVTIAKTGTSPISFAQGTGAGTDQFIRVSANPLPLQEAPVAGIKLSDQSNKVIIPNLPNPSLMLVKTEGADTFSDILITI